jgi:hypothetical protein
MKKIILLLFFLIIFNTTCFAVDIQVGQYLRLGNYDGNPIIWRCVSIDENGPLMLAHNVLTYKSFDSSGVHKNDISSYRLNYGSNNWQISNLRSWLNSTATAGNVYWECGVASSDYGNEKGFLNSTNFSSSDLNSIKYVVQSNILNYQDRADVQQGKEFLLIGGKTFAFNSDIESSKDNLEDAYSKRLTDRIFVLDSNQVNSIITNKNILGNRYQIGKPTANAVGKSIYQGSEVSMDKGTNSWLRMPVGNQEYPEFSTFLSAEGYLDFENANSQKIGVRPAFYFDTKSTAFSVFTGNGTLSSPVRVNGTLRKFDFTDYYNANNVATINIDKSLVSANNSLILVNYNENGELLNTKFQPVLNNVFEYYFQNSSSDTGKKVKVFLWNSIDGIKPLIYNVEKEIK